MDVPRMRTLPEAIKELKKADPETAYTLRALRAAVNKGEISVVNVGNKRLINYDRLLEMLNMPSSEPKNTNEGTENRIRKLV